MAEGKQKSGSGSYFTGAGEAIQTPSIFIELPHGKTVELIFLRIVPGKFSGRGLVYSMKAGKCFLLQEHSMLTGALEEIGTGATPVMVTRLPGTGRTQRYQVRRFPAVPADDPIHVLIGHAERETMAEYARYRNVPVDGAREAEDDDLPF